MPAFGPVKYLRRTFDSIHEYPAPEDGETITAWIDRLHDMNISCGREELLAWYWPHMVVDSYEVDLVELQDWPIGSFFRWARTIYATNDDDLMILKLTYSGLSTIQKPERLK